VQKWMLAGQQEEREAHGERITLTSVG